MSARSKWIPADDISRQAVFSVGLRSNYLLTLKICPGKWCNPCGILCIS